MIQIKVCNKSLAKFKLDYFQEFSYTATQTEYSQTEQTLYLISCMHVSFSLHCTMNNNKNFVPS